MTSCAPFLRAHMRNPLSKALRKRTRRDYDEASAPPMQDLPLPRPSCVALQNEDHEEDAVVITALDVVPFCCHADLLTMDRLQLARVALTLNAKLPLILQIDIRPSRPDVDIRNEIERLVGICTDDEPETPKPVKSLPAYARAGGRLESPTSPLANKSRPDASKTNAALAALQEVDENVAVEPPSKKRRFDPEEFFRVSPARPPARAIMRSQSDHVMTVGSPNPLKQKILRTQSQKMPRALRSIHPNVNTTRGRTGSRTVLSGRSTSVFTTSTPKRRKLTHEGSGGALPAKPTSKLATTVAPAFDRGVDRVLKRKLNELSMDETDVTFDIEGMTIPALHSRMEVDSDA